MNKNIFFYLGEWWEQRSVRKFSSFPKDATSFRWLPSPGSILFTLLVVGLLVWAQTAGALPGLANSQSEIQNSQSTIPYQGRLADADGNPVTDTVNMVFRLYGQASGGGPLWEEQWTGSNGVQVSDGLFNVMLGSLNPIPQDVITGHDNLFLGITAGTDDEMTPRVQLGSVPFAVQALTIPDGSVTTEKIADGAVTQAKLKSGTVVNRYYIPWFDDEQPCTTSSTTFVHCGNILGYGFVNSFPPPASGTIRRYRLMVANGDNLKTSGSSYLRVRKHGGEEIYVFNLGRRWSWKEYQKWVYSDPITFNERVHLDLEIRLSEPNHTLWLYRVWVMAEDVIP